MIINAVDIIADQHVDSIEVDQDELISQVKEKIERIRGKSLTNYVMIWKKERVFKLIEWRKISYYKIPDNSQIRYLPTDTFDAITDTFDEITLTNLPTDLHDNLNKTETAMREVDGATIIVIREIEKFANDWENTYYHIKNGKIAGPSLGIIGGISTILGCGFAIFATGGVLAPVLLGGGTIVGLAGGATSIVSSIIDVAKTKDTYKSVNKALKDLQTKVDKLHEVAEPIREWLNRCTMTNAAKICCIVLMLSGAWKGKDVRTMKIVIETVCGLMRQGGTVGKTALGFFEGLAVEAKMLKEVRKSLKTTKTGTKTLSKEAVKTLKSVGIVSTVFLVFDIIDLVSVVQDEDQFANELRKLANDLKKAYKPT